MVRRGKVDRHREDSSILSRLPIVCRRGREGFEINVLCCTGMSDGSSNRPCSAPVIPLFFKPSVACSATTYRLHIGGNIPATYNLQKLIIHSFHPIAVLHHANIHHRIATYSQLTLNLTATVNVNKKKECLRCFPSH